jgi:hypothetical protein
MIRETAKTSDQDKVHGVAAPGKAGETRVAP